MPKWRFFFVILFSKLTAVSTGIYLKDNFGSIGSATATLLVMSMFILNIAAAVLGSEEGRDHPGRRR